MNGGSDGESGGSGGILLKSIHGIGSAGPWILFANSLMMLRNRHAVFWYYVAGWIMNVGVNVLLKWFIRSPRPAASGAEWKKYSIALANGRVMLDFNQYGMPSGHAQICAFSLAFIAMWSKRVWIVFFYFLMTAVSMFQRVEMKQHTVLQVVVGACVGTGLGWAVFRFAEQHKRGEVMRRKDDGAPAWTGFA